MLDCFTTRVRQLRRTLRRWRRDDGSLIAASMAYYAVLSFFPLLLLLISVLGFVLQFSSGAQDAQKELLRILAQNTSVGLAEHVETALTAIRTNAVIGGPLGLFTLFVAAIGIFTQLDVAMDRIWDTRRKRSPGIAGAIRNVLFHRLRAFLMLLALGLLVWVAFIAGAVASALRPYAADLIGGDLAWASAHAGLSLLVNGALLSMLYKMLPRAKVSWRAARPGWHARLDPLGSQPSGARPRDVRQEVHRLWRRRLADGVDALDLHRREHLLLCRGVRSSDSERRSVVMAGFMGAMLAKRAQRLRQACPRQAGGWIERSEPHHGWSILRFITH